MACLFNSILAAVIVLNNLSRGGILPFSLLLYSTTVFFYSIVVNRFMYNSVVTAKLLRVTSLNYLYVHNGITLRQRTKARAQNLIALKAC